MEGARIKLSTALSTGSYLAEAAEFSAYAETLELTEAGEYFGCAEEAASTAGKETATFNEDSGIPSEYPPDK